MNSPSSQWPIRLAKRWSHLRTSIDFARKSIVRFLWQDVTDVDSASDMVGEISLFETSEVLIYRILDAIRLRRSVLVTGPRGSGKTFCAQRAIHMATKLGIVGGHHFLQGNREIPRDYLNEDTLVIREGAGKHAEPKLLDALVIRFPGLESEEMKALREKRKELKRSDSELANDSATFPGVLRLLEGDDIVWQSKDWIVLFLDEINRFSDGFLDSLLSLTEERIVVRGGVELHVPIVLVATANPPGYDITAKKLSPPLQARISRSYRVSQPTHESMVYRILPEQIGRYRKAFASAEKSGTEKAVVVKVAPAIRKLVSGAALCLWGLPTPDRKGAGFLTPATQDLIRGTVEGNPSFADDLTAIGEMLSFGPDARSVGDWIGCAMGVARRDAIRNELEEIELNENHLLECALEALAHKVRENFNEGAEPDKVARKERLISRIVLAVLTHDRLRNHFLLPFEAAVRGILGIALDTIVPADGVPTELADSVRDLGLEVVAAFAEPRRRSLLFALGRVQALAHEKVTDAILVEGTLQALREGAAAAVLTASISDVGLLDHLRRRVEDAEKQRQERMGREEAAQNPDTKKIAALKREETQLAGCRNHLERLQEKVVEMNVDPTTQLLRESHIYHSLRPFTEQLAAIASKNAAALGVVPAFRVWLACIVAVLDALEEAPSRRGTWLRLLSPGYDDLIDARTAGEPFIVTSMLESRMLVRFRELVNVENYSAPMAAAHQEKVADALSEAVDRIAEDLTPSARAALRGAFDKILPKATAPAPVELAPSQGEQM